MNLRYSRKEMYSIWTRENKFATWLEIELLICEAQAEIGVIPKDIPPRLREKADFDVARIDVIEEEVKHDVIAFLTSVAEHVGPEARYIHLGITSSDIIDTSFAVLLRQSADMILKGIDAVLVALKKRIEEHKNTICTGRSHGIHAEPTTFGLKLAGHYCAFKRARERMINAREEISTCTISGAVGTFASVDPRVESYVAEKLGMKIEPVSTQVIPRDRHAMFFCTLGVLAASIENLATEVRHLQRTEVREAEEFFAPGQKGSSAMPHKRNPILTENLTGMSRLIRSAVTPALENITLWHERDISHSSVERIIGPDATVLTDFALHRLANVIDNLLVYPARMRKNMEMTRGLVFSQSVLISLAAKGMSREDAYKIVQGHAMKVWDGESDFQTLVSSDPAVQEKLSEEELTALFNYNRFIKRVGTILDGVLND